MALGRRALREYIRTQRLAVISSVAADGCPQSALVGIAVTESLELVFDTLDTSRKCANLRADPRIAAVIGWQAEQTVQYEGLADEPSGAELGHLQQIYFQAWPDGPERLTWPGITYFRVRPRWVRFSDFGQQPPAIEELAF
jgi:pyridoxine/pyridoxamine 5'-phosphate oxidase